MITEPTVKLTAEILIDAAVRQQVWNRCQPPAFFFRAFFVVYVKHRHEQKSEKQGDENDVCPGTSFFCRQIRKITEQLVCRGTNQSEQNNKHFFVESIAGPDIYRFGQIHRQHRSGSFLFEALRQINDFSAADFIVKNFNPFKPAGKSQRQIFDLFGVKMEN